MQGEENLNKHGINILRETRKDYIGGTAGCSAHIFKDPFREQEKLLEIKI